MDHTALTALFRKLGASDPGGWARSQVEEGIPQLARFVFLRQAWRQIVTEEDSSWIDVSIEHADASPNGPYADVGHALKKLRARGGTNEEITALVRGMQAQLLFALCHLLEDPGDVEPEIADISWTLVQVDDEGNSLARLGGLHESVLETDPTGREMRPKTSHIE